MAGANRPPRAQPLPIIDLVRCNGCGLCVSACPVGALAVIEGQACIATPEACDYFGLCEMRGASQLLTPPQEKLSAGLLVANAALGVVVLLVSGILAGLAAAP